MNPRQEQKESQYYISYASANDHAFVIISKEILWPNKKKHIKVMASFGLYGETDKLILPHVTCGGFSENGRIRSDHYYLDHAQTSDHFRIHIGVKSYPLSSRQQALNILKEIKKDSSIKPLLQAKYRKKPTLMPADDKLDAKFPAHRKNLTQSEKKYIYWARLQLNENQRGGPQFNTRDFNCKKYAISILRKSGIYDPEIESGRYPDNASKGLKPATFTDDNWDTNLNISPPISKVPRNYPKSYSTIFNTYQDPVAGALALLKDYSDNTVVNGLFHAKRHYKNEVRNAVNYARVHKLNSIETILACVYAYLPPYRDMTGSLQKRLDFLFDKQQQLNSFRPRLFATKECKHHSPTSKCQESKLHTPRRS